MKLARHLLEKTRPPTNGVDSLLGIVEYCPLVSKMELHGIFL